MDVRMIFLAWWLLLFGVWPIGTFEAHHSDLSTPTLTADLLAHGLGVVLLAVLYLPGLLRRWRS